mmetsp:Transcript_31582/g.72080  ORF Transcript_31582/g.72080 Transcript_31582/m.72080 type:complete len:205 (+) Transcript_31582:963-1577(+)
MSTPMGSAASVTGAATSCLSWGMLGAAIVLTFSLPRATSCRCKRGWPGTAPVTVTAPLGATGALGAKASVSAVGSSNRLERLAESSSGGKVSCKIGWAITWIWGNLPSASACLGGALTGSLCKVAKFTPPYTRSVWQPTAGLKSTSCPSLSCRTVECLSLHSWGIVVGPPSWRSPAKLNQLSSTLTSASQMNLASTVALASSLK